MHAAAVSRPIQLHLALFPQHVLDAVEQEEARREQKKEKRRLATHVAATRRDAQRHALIEAMNLSLLDAPLLAAIGPNELDCSVDPLLAPDDFSLEEQTGTQAGWSDQAIYELHEAVLHHTLKVLQARGNGAEKREALKWIFAPERYVATLDLGGRKEEVLLPPELTPFSFEMCSRICGYRSEMLMDLLQPILSGLGLGSLFNELTHATSFDESGGSKRAGETPDQAVQGA